MNPNGHGEKETYLVDQFQNLRHDHVQYDEIGQEEVDERNDEKPLAVCAVKGMHMRLQCVHERSPLVPNDADLNEGDEGALHVLEIYNARKAWHAFPCCTVHRHAGLCHRVVPPSWALGHSRKAQHAQRAKKIRNQPQYESHLPKLDEYAPQRSLDVPRVAHSGHSLGTYPVA